MAEEVKDKKMGNKEEETKTEKVEEKKTEVKEEKKVVVKKAKPVKKDVAIANGFSLRISPRQSVSVCKVIMGKSPENAIVRLEEVIAEKRAVPMAATEAGHKKGRGLAGAKYPKNACRAIIDIVKQAGANAIVNGIENPVITIAKSDRASAPFRKAGRKAKRAHIHIEIKERGAKA